jgi:hypothetical protein
MMLPVNDGDRRGILTGLSKKLQFVAGICVFVVNSYKIVTLLPGWKNVSMKDTVPVLPVSISYVGKLITFSYLK